MTQPRLYTELADWYPLLSVSADYEEEAAIFMEALDELAPRPIRTMLELGCGALVIPEQIAVRQVSQAFDETDKLKDEPTAKLFEQVLQRLVEMARRFA